MRDLVIKLDSLNICPGNPDDEYVKLIEERKGSIKSGQEVSSFLDTYATVLYKHKSYDSTVRSSTCHLVTDDNQCPACSRYRATLRGLLSRWKKSKLASPKRRTSLSSQVNFRYLKTPEKMLKLRSIRMLANLTKRKLLQLKLQIKKANEKSLVAVDKELGEDLSRMFDALPKCSASEDSFEHLFWEEQRKVNLAKSGMHKWHPMVVRWCLNLKLTSTTAYETLRSSKLLKLPSSRTLRDYTHWVQGKSGFQNEVDMLLYKEAKIDDCPEYAKYHCLVFDEIKVKEGLVYNKEQCHVIGFTRLDDISNHLKEYERCVVSGKSPQEVASHMLVFMVRGLFTSLEFPYIQFPVNSLSAESIYPLVWECINHLEMLGLKVLAITADGASCNRKFFRMHKSAEKAKLIYKTINVASGDRRPIFFFSDVPHLVKTVRNAWANSGSHDNTRQLYVSYCELKTSIL